MDGHDELVMTCLSYDTLFDDFDSVDIKKLASGIPYLAALDLFVAKHNKFYYCLSDLSGQKNELFELRCSFIKESDTLARLDRFITGQENPYLIDNISTLYFELFVLQFADKNTSVRVLSADQKAMAYKLYLYCSKLWLDIQQKNIEGIDALDLNLKVDVPVTEFKFPADFHAQVYKANEFFTFCNKTKPFDTIVQWLMKDRGKNNFQEYLLDIFELFRKSIDTHMLKKSQLPASVYWFLDKYCFDITCSEDLCSNLNLGIRYLRNCFFVKFDSDSYALLNPTFMIDKFYEGLVFDMWDAVKSRHGMSTVADGINDFTEIKSKLGRPFAEEHLFYTIMDNCFDSTSIVRIKGADFDGVDSPPDYYMRDGNNVFFFECKDALFNNNKRYSTDLNTIKQELLKSICRDGDKDRKGGAQLLYTIDKYINKDSLSGFDRKHEPSDNIYPIIVTTNSAFNAYGVNILLLVRFIEIVRDKYPTLAGKMKLPVIINMDCFIRLMYDFHNGKCSLNELLDDYIDNYLQKPSIKMMPSFYHYIRTMYNGKTMTQEEHLYLFGNLFNSFAQIMAKQ